MKTANGRMTDEHPFLIARQAVNLLENSDAFRFETEKTSALFFRKYPDAKTVSVTDGVELNLYMNTTEMIGMIAGIVMCSQVIDFKTVPLEDVPDV